MQKLFALALTFGLSAAAHADSTTIDFTSMTYGTPITNQFSGVTFSLSGGDSSATAPVIGGFSTPYGLSNTGSGNYPTNEDLNAVFSSAQSSISFSFDNYGDNVFGPTTVAAYNAAGTLLAIEDLEFAGSLSGGFDPYTIAGTGITTLVFDNGSFGNYDWEFAVGEITYNTAVVSTTPEPASIVTLGTGILGIGAQLLRRRRS